MEEKIVFINQATGYLTIDVINEFAGEFDEVALITGSIRVQDTPLDPRVKVTWIVRYNRGNLIQKFSSWIIGTFQIYWLLKFRYREYQKFFYTIPPTAYLLSGWLNSRISVAVFDLYPEALKAFGFRENGIIYRWWSRKNMKIFSKAHRVYTLSDRMKSKILKYSPGIDVREISNWSAFSGFKPIRREDNKIISREKLKGKFIVQYSGNIGITHRVEVLVELAGLLKDQTDIEFLIIGRGNRSNVIGDMITRKELNNCRLLPYRNDEELYESLCVADIAVVTLDDKIPDISVPSKVYNIMAAGVPIMAITHPESATSEIVLKHKAGEVFNKDDLTGMLNFILKLKKDSFVMTSLSQNSLKAAGFYTNKNAKAYLENYKK